MMQRPMMQPISSIRICISNCDYNPDCRLHWLHHLHSENVSQVLCTDSRNTMCPSKNKVAFLTVLCLAPFTFLRSMKTLEIPTLLANVALLGGIMWLQVR